MGKITLRKYAINITLLKKLIKEKYNSLEKVSGMMGITRQTLYNIIQSKYTTCSLFTFIRLCETLDIEPNKAIYVKGEKNKNE